MAKDKEVTYPIQLTWNKTYVVIGIALGLIGGIYNAGIKTQYEISRGEIAKIETKKQEDIGNLKLTLGRELQESQENLTFFKNQYHVTKSRLDACLKDGEFPEFFESKVKDKTE